MPPAPLSSGSVRAISVKMPACGRVGDEALGAVDDVVVAVAHRASVRSEAASEPASGSVSAKERDQLAGRQARQVVAASAPRCRRTRCPASRCRPWCRSASGTPARPGPARTSPATSSSIVSPRPPYSSGMRQAEQAQRAHVARRCPPGSRRSRRRAPRSGSGARVRSAPRCRSSTFIVSLVADHERSTLRCVVERRSTVEGHDCRRSRRTVNAQAQLVPCNGMAAEGMSGR